MNGQKVFLYYTHPSQNRPPPASTQSGNKWYQFTFSFKILWIWICWDEGQMELLSTNRTAHLTSYIFTHLNTPTVAYTNTCPMKLLWPAPRHIGSPVLKKPASRICFWPLSTLLWSPHALLSLISKDKKELYVARHTNYGEFGLVWTSD